MWEDNSDTNSRYINLAICSSGSSHNLCAKFELHALLLKDALEVLGDLHIDAHAANMAQELDGSHFGSQSLPHWTLQSRNIDKKRFRDSNISKN